MSRPKALEALAQALARLPGIGATTSERLAYHLVAVPKDEALGLAAAIRLAREQIKVCSKCSNIDERDPCWVCEDESRDRRLILVVEGPREVAAFEAAGYRGLYHVLQGRIAPLEGVGEADLTIASFLARVRALIAHDDEAAAPIEVCLATNPDLEGESTARLLSERLAPLAVRVTRIARGIPAGASIAQVQRTILGDALEGRRPL